MKTTVNNKRTLKAFLRVALVKKKLITNVEINKARTTNLAKSVGQSQ